MKFIIEAASVANGFAVLVTSPKGRRRRLTICATCPSSSRRTLEALEQENKNTCQNEVTRPSVLSTRVTQRKPIVGLIGWRSGIDKAPTGRLSPAFWPF